MSQISVGAVAAGLSALNTLSGSAGILATPDAFGNIQIVAGAGIVTTGGLHSITIDSGAGALDWINQLASPLTMALDSGYVQNFAGLLVATLPAIAPVLTVVAIVGNNAGGWIINTAAGQTIELGNMTAATSISSTDRYSCVELMCVVANTTWVARSSFGNITVV